ncbi:mediator of RNA polymerase II transcription subunit 24-like [Cyanistes caeruleus]|uniref:mediator of RNA polymerase II transcription subunit 24-like n=1 Tax=Cyanistes caeruleus TaxID=156563 RepID=UPI000CDB73F3|nr:mediator of RNA polymerase II transcription subunit 24-like [Cyanistes caeruleus]
MKVVNLKQAILQAWKERWSDYQWAINMKRFFPRGATWDILNLAEALLEQAMIGPSPNPLILSYLKYAISSQMVSYSTVLMAISKVRRWQVLSEVSLFTHKPTNPFPSPQLPPNIGQVESDVLG